MRDHRSILSAGNDWSRVVLLDNEIWPEHGRRDLAAIAAERGQEPLDAVYDLLLAGVDELHALMVIIHAYSEEQQREAFAHELCVPGSDATTLAPDGPLAGSCFHGAYTWASWFWRFTREEGLLTPEDAIHRLTGQPAERIGLSDRGVLRDGRPRRRRRLRSGTRSPSAARPSSRTSSRRACGTCSSTACRRSRTGS